MALPQPVDEVEPITPPVEVRRIRRCTYRRLDRAPDGRGGTEPSYDVSCVYPNRSVARPIGDLETSLAVCAICTASHIFRPDED